MPGCDAPSVRTQHSCSASALHAPTRLMTYEPMQAGNRPSAHLSQLGRLSAAANMASTALASSSSLPSTQLSTRVSEAPTAMLAVSVVAAPQPALAHWVAPACSFSWQRSSRASTCADVYARADTRRRAKLYRQPASWALVPPPPAASAASAARPRPASCSAASLPRSAELSLCCTSLKALSAASRASRLSRLEAAALPSAAWSFFALAASPDPTQASTRASSEAPAMALASSRRRQPRLKLGSSLNGWDAGGASMTWATENGSQSDGHARLSRAAAPDVARGWAPATVALTACCRWLRWLEPPCCDRI